jgi:hypothetical protein
MPCRDLRLRAVNFGLPLRAFGYIVNVNPHSGTSAARLSRQRSASPREEVTS